MSSLQKASLLLLTSRVFGAANGAYVEPNAKRQTTDNLAATFDWNSLAPSTELNWVDCYSAPLKCARLSVPLNYSNPDDGTGTVALVSWPSPLANTSAYRGPVLMNPGGPGGSGVDTVVGAGALFQSILGEEFDVIGFDPRGVGASTPALTFPGTEEEAHQYNTGFAELFDLGEESWPTLPERMQALEDFAIINERERGDILKHATTDNVARDMLSIVKAHGLEKLQYYGLSYGTALGAVFATLFPDKVERIILDGVLDMDGYYNNEWSVNVSDADKALEWFFTTCVAAGPSLCAFHSPSVTAIRERYETIQTRIQNGTITYPDGRPFPLSYFQTLVFFQLYAPLRFPAFAKALVAAEEGDFSPLEDAFKGAGIAPYTGVALRCTDTASMDDTAEELMDYSVDLRNASKYLHGAVEGVRLCCVGWKVNPGGFGTPFGGNTSVPILFVGNSADPGTPLIAAKQTAAKFPGSRALEFAAPGHSTLALHGNECIAAHFRNYMINGTLPEEGTVCEDPRGFFSSSKSDAGDVSKALQIATEKIHSILLHPHF